MVAGQPQTEIGRISDELAALSGLEPEKAALIANRARNYVRKFPADIAGRLALASALTFCGQRDAALEEARNVYAGRGSLSPLAQNNFLGLLISLGLTEEARHVASRNDIGATADVRPIMGQSRYALYVGDTDLLGRLSLREKDLRAPRQLAQIAVATLHDNPLWTHLAARQALANRVAAPHMAGFAIDVGVDDEANPYLEFVYLIAASRPVLKRLKAELFEVLDDFYGAHDLRAAVAATADVTFSTAPSANPLTDAA